MFKVNKEKIPHSKPFFDSEDELYILEVLRDRYVTNGKRAETLGSAGAELLSKKWGLPTQSGTDAMTLALHLLSLKENDKVIVPAYICSAPLDALALNKLLPEVVDIDPDTMAVSIDKVNENPCNNVIAAHMFGIPAPLHRIEKTNLIEDCAQTLKTSSEGNIVGASGRLAVCSFYGTKLLTSGHGGLLAGNESELFDNAVNCMTHDKQEKWSPHFHFMMSDLNAALALSQLKKLNGFIDERRNIAMRFAEALGQSKLPENCIYSRFLLYSESESADLLIKRFQKAGIEAKRPVYKPLYMYLGLDDKDYPNAKWVHDHIVSVPIYPGMPGEHIQRIETFLEKSNDLRCRPSA